MSVRRFFRVSADSASLTLAAQTLSNSHGWLTAQRWNSSNAWVSSCSLQAGSEATRRMSMSALRASGLTRRL
jgi:hypothetical protein